MEVPTTREIELETLLRERDAQVTQLTDEVSHLRTFLNEQPAPSTTDPTNLPPGLTALILPHINSKHAPLSSGEGSGNSLNTATAALLQRAKVLQEENDELYNLLKQGEVGKLKEEVRGLRRVVRRLEDALKESHGVINSLSSELEKAYESPLSVPPQRIPQSTPPQQQRMNGPAGGNTQRQNGNLSAHQDSTPPSRSPAVDTRQLPPTAPRSQKKPRMANDREPNNSTHAAPNQGNNGGRRQGEGRARERGGRSRRRSRSRDARGRGGGGGKATDSRRDASPAERLRERSSPRNAHGRSSSPNRERERDSRRGERGGDRDRDSRRVRDRPPQDSERPSRRNDRGRDRSLDSDRTLASRMGL